MSPGHSASARRRPWPISAWCRSLAMRGVLGSMSTRFCACSKLKRPRKTSRRLWTPHRSGSPMQNKSAPLTMDAVYAKPGYLFRRMQQIAVAIFVEECKAYDLTPVQYAALVAIRTHPGIDATRLSAVIAFDRSTLGNVIERLEAKHFIERKPSREDRRGKLLFLTQSGGPVLGGIIPSLHRPPAPTPQALQHAVPHTLMAPI